MLALSAELAVFARKPLSLLPSFRGEAGAAGLSAPYWAPAVPFTFEESIGVLLPLFSGRLLHAVIKAAIVSISVSFFMCYELI